MSRVPELNTRCFSEGQDSTLGSSPLSTVHNLADIIADSYHERNPWGGGVGVGVTEHEGRLHCTTFGTSRLHARGSVVSQDSHNPERLAHKEEQM